jgi:beta-xylosidase
MLNTRNWIAAFALSLSSAFPNAAIAQAETYNNPVLFADYSDPDVIRVGRYYYLVASSFHLSPGLPVLRSPDLVNWEIVSHILPRLNFAAEYDMVPPFGLTDAISKPLYGTRYGSGVWAPSLRYHNKRFYAYWATPDEGVFVSTAVRAEGPWSAPVQVIAKPGLEDPCPIWDDDGTAWLIHSRVGAGPLILHRMSADGMSVLDEGELIVEDHQNLPVLEGPKFYKRGGYYYIFAPIGSVEKGPQVVMRSRNIRGPYEWRVVLEQNDTKLQGPHQGGYVETPSGEGWFMHFNSTGAFGRIVHLQPVNWVDDWPVIGEAIPGKTSGRPVANYAMPDTGYRGAKPVMQASDDFSAAKLGLQWQWNHNPADAAWSLTARPGWMRLRALPAGHLATARNTLTQMLQGPASTITAAIDFTGLGEGQRAGLAMFGSRPSWLGLVRENGHNRLTFSSEGNEIYGPDIVGDQIQFRVSVGEDQLARYAYSIDSGQTFTAFGEPAAMRFAWWKGARPAIFTYLKSPPATTEIRSWIDVDWVQVTSNPHQSTP